MLKNFIFIEHRLSVIIGIVMILFGTNLYAQQPDITVSPISLSDSLYHGEISKQWIIISNDGVSDLTFDISIEGEDSRYALEFDGIDDYVEVPDNPSLSAIGGTFTLECWINVEQDPIHGQKILGKWGNGGSSDDEYDLDFPSSGGILEMAISGSSGGMTEIRSNPIPPYTWTHFAGVFDSASTSCKIFVNGILDSDMTPSTITMNRDTDQPFRMGTCDFGSVPYFKGQMDEVRIWNVARTQAEIQANMNQELSGAEPGLIGYWKFDEGSGSTAHGSSPNNNDGTLHNGVAWVVSSSAESWLSVDPTSGIVPAGNSVIVEVTFDARSLVGGDYYADIVISSNDPDEPEVVIPAHLNVTGIPDIAVSEDALDYGIVFLGYSSTDTLIVSNDGTDLLTVSDISSDNSDFTVDITSVILNPGERQEVEIVLTPSSVGIIEGNLTITSDDPNEHTLNIFLHGEGLEPPDISVLPDFLIDSLFTGETSVDTLTISNTGSSDLIFDISIEEMLLESLNKMSVRKNSRSSQFEYLEVGKDEIDFRVGNQVVLGSGGPDTFGYTWIDSDEGGSCQFDWVDISSTGTLVIGLSDDSYVGPYPINFEFPFYDSVYNEFYISSNGFIGFGPTSGYYNLSNQPIPTSNSPNNIIAWCWDDLYPRGSVYYEDFGDRLIVQFVDYGEFGASGRINAEVVLHRSGQITIQYLNSYDGFDLLGNTVGIENMTGYDGLQVAFNTGYIHDSLAVEFSIGPSWLSIEPISDTIPSGDSVKVEVTFDATGLFGGDYSADILINSNDPDEPEVIVPAHLNVTGAPNIVVSTDTLDYNVVFTGYSDTNTLVVSNEGTDLLTVSDIVSDNSDYTVDISSFTIDPGETQDIEVTFTPSSLGIITGNLTITSDDPSNPTVTVFLQGECVEPPDISVSPDSLSDTLLTGETSMHTLKLYNTGESDLNFIISIEGGGSSYALEFDGVDDYVEVPDNPSLSAIGGTFTLECWINVEQDPIHGQKILGKWGNGGSSDDEYDLDFPSSGGILEMAISGSSGGMTEIRSNPIPPYTWTHFAGVFDSASTSCKIFVNGILDSDMTPSTITMNRDTDQPFRMGTCDFGSVPYFKGQMDEVRIWNVARTQAEIQANMNKELSGTEPGLIGYWKFNEGSGSTAHGSSPNNNDGTLHNGVAWVVSSSPVVNWIYVDTASGTIPAADSVIVEVTFDARSLVGGDYYADIVISSNDPDESAEIIPAHLTIIGTGIEEDTSEQKPKRYLLYQNYPNPFINSTEIKYGLPKEAKVNIIIYNLVGQIVTTLVNEKRKAGYHTVIWDGRNEFDRQVASGVYFCRLKVGNYTLIKKMNLIR